MLLAVVGRADAQPGKRVAVIAAFERQQCAAAGVDHRRLQREVDRLGSTGRAEAGRQRTGGQRREQPRELRPRRIRVTGIDVIGPLEAFDGFRDRRGAPPEIPDAPAHHEVDVLPAARVGDDAAVRGGNLQLRWQLSGERLAASSGHERSFPCAAMATASLSGISAFVVLAHTNAIYSPPGIDGILLEQREGDFGSTAIVLHTTSSIGRLKASTFPVPASGIGCDYGGFGYQDLSEGDKKATLTAYPRLQMKNALTTCLCDIARNHPNTTRDNFIADL